MDTFEKAMEDMMNMRDENRAKLIKTNKKECICPDCPSYTECAGDEEELLYCSLGKSPDCITEGKGCICPECPLTTKLGLKNTYFCLKSSEKEQRGFDL